MKNAIKSFFAAVIILATATTANANRQNSPIEFRYVGKMEQHPVYQLNISNADNDEYYISFSDQSGNVLYSSNVRTGTFSQRFMINADEVGNEVLTVSIVSRKTNKSQVYTIKRSQNVVEENVVTRVK